jgi:hypothetical protein
LPQFFRKLSSGFRGGLGVGEQTDEFVGRDRAIAGAPDIGREPQRLLGSAELRLLKPLPRYLRPERQGRQRQDVADDLPLDL